MSVKIGAFMLFKYDKNRKILLRYLTWAKFEKQIKTSKKNGQLKS